MSHREQQVRERAYGIWEREGRPEGRDRDHWSQAERDLGPEGADEKPQGRKRASTAKAATAKPAATKPASRRRKPALPA